MNNKNWGTCRSLIWKLDDTFINLDIDIDSHEQSTPCFYEYLIDYWYANYE